MAVFDRCRKSDKMDGMYCTFNCKKPSGWSGHQCHCWTLKEDGKRIGTQLNSNDPDFFKEIREQQFENKTLLQKCLSYESGEVDEIKCDARRTRDLWCRLGLETNCTAIQGRGKNRKEIKYKDKAFVRYFPVESENKQEETASVLTQPIATPQPATKVQSTSQVPIQPPTAQITTKPDELAVDEPYFLTLINPRSSLLTSDSSGNAVPVKEFAAAFLGVIILFVGIITVLGWKLNKASKRRRAEPVINEDMVELQ